VNDASGERRGARDAISVVHAPPFLTLQDGGRPGHRAAGVPPSGAMDPWALALANLLVGNAPGAAALEWALGAGAIRFEAPAVVALAGAEVDVSLGGEPAAPYRTLAADAGGVLAVERFVHGRFLYVAVRGGVDVPPLLGSRATYLPGRFGGLDGRRLRAGDRIPVGVTDAPAPRTGFTLPEALRPAYAAPGGAVLRLVCGPQAAVLDDAGWAEFLGAVYRVSRLSDRMGYRLEGPAPVVGAVGTAALPSEPACPGAVQLPAGGMPIVLMVDGPTVGGYPKPAVVASADLSALAQRTPGEEVRFRLVTVEEAQKAYRRRAVELHTVAHVVRGG
jgi:antagonist of KipI